MITGMSVCLSVCAHIKQLLTDLNQIVWKGGSKTKEEVIKF